MTYSIYFSINGKDCSYDWIRSLDEARDWAARIQQNDKRVSNVRILAIGAISCEYVS